MNRSSKIIRTCFTVLSTIGIVAALLGRIYCTRVNHDNFKELQPESFVPDIIETVLHDEELKQIYVCYNDANCVNVYTETGDFLWCVSTPYLRNSYFELHDGKLIICDGEAYVYDCADGTFLGIKSEDDLELNYEFGYEYTDEYIDGNFYFDSYNVYAVNANGVPEKVVSRPWWHMLFNVYLWFALTFIAAMGIGFCIIFQRTQEYISAKKVTSVNDKKARFIKNYYKATSLAQLFYSVVNILLSFITDIFIIGILPVGMHYIISNIVLWNIEDKLSCSSNETKIINFWKTVELISMIAVFVSVVVASVIAG